MLLCMTLIVAMAMESEKITECIGTPFTAGRDVIDLYQIALGKVQFTPTTFPLLLVQQGSQFALGERVRLVQSLGPIEQISIKWTDRAFDLHMALDRSCGMIAEIQTIRRCKAPVILSHCSPVARSYPTCRLARMSAFSPAKQERKQVVITVIEGFLGGDAAVVA